MKIEFTPIEMVIRIPLTRVKELKNLNVLPRMTKQTRITYELVMQGKTNKEIASVLGISERGAKFHVTSLFDALGVRNRTDVISGAWAK